MKRVRLAFFEEKYRYELQKLLKLFQKDVYKETREFDLQNFIDKHYGLIYVILNDESECIGFTSFVYNGYFGLRGATLGNDFIYIMKDYRLTKAMHLISIQAGVLCQDYNVPLEHYYASDDSCRFIGRMKGNRMYSTYIFPIEEVSKETERLKTKVRIKE